MNIIIVGVGGQGTLLASRLLGNIFIDEGLDVKVSEVHGMSQRGGSVTTYVRCDEKVYSPIIEQGEADYILAFEMLEAMRAIPYLKKGGKIIANAQKTDPMPVSSGAAKYPENIEGKLSAVADLTTVDATALAIEAGDIKAANVALIGVLAKRTEIPKEKWIAAVRKTVKPKYADINVKAFELGYQI